MNEATKAFLASHRTAKTDALLSSFWDETEVEPPVLSEFGIEGCGCWECACRIVSARPFPENLAYPFIVCAECGNKRCPKASSHVNQCSGSNEYGQPGATRYGG